jgi:hypothetical protein
MIAHSSDQARRPATNDAADSNFIPVSAAGEYRLPNCRKFEIVLQISRHRIARKSRYWRPFVLSSGEMTMSKFIKFAVAGTVLFASVSITSAQDRAASSRAASARNSFAHSPVQSGPYVPSPKRVKARLPVRPFTWEEKRLFDLTNGEEG